MKKMIIGLVLILVIAIGAIVIVTQKDNQAKKDQDAYLYEESSHATGDDIFTKDGKNIYYFYQESCAHCNDAKPNLIEFKTKLEKSDSDVVFNVVDMAAVENKDLWYQGDDYTTDPNYKDNPDDIKTLSDLQIVGTPTMIYVEDGVVKNYMLGNPQIYSFLNELGAKIGLDINLK